MIFYNKYKKFRIDNNIDLKDISKRTKIDIIYLQSIEKGKFAEIPGVYVKLFFKAYINEIGVDTAEALDELDGFLNQKTTSKKFKLFKNLNNENLFNSSILLGIGCFVVVLFLSFFLNSNNELSQSDLENELRITKSDLIEFYAERSQEVISIDDIVTPITIRFHSNKENYINYYDNFSGKEFFIFEETMNSQSNSFTEIWNGESKSFLIANTIDFELIIFSEDIYKDFSQKILNDFPVEVILGSDPYTMTVVKYLPKN
jgi:transcriptional regulator with XRE-family HTH domain